MTILMIRTPVPHGMPAPSWERSFSEPYVRLQCECGWTGYDDDVDGWAVQPARDRVVRRCPDCGTPVPEWGALRPIDGAARIARGPLRTALAESEYDADVDPS
jgi:hypothetical protein